jgi:hypothetical protein
LNWRLRVHSRASPPSAAFVSGSVVVVIAVVDGVGFVVVVGGVAVVVVVVSTAPLASFGALVVDVVVVALIAVVEAAGVCAGTLTFVAHTAGALASPGAAASGEVGLLLCDDLPRGDVVECDRWWCLPLPLPLCLCCTNTVTHDTRTSPRSRLVCDDLCFPTCRRAEDSSPVTSTHQTRVVAVITPHHLAAAVLVAMRSVLAVNALA